MENPFDMPASPSRTHSGSSRLALALNSPGLDSPNAIFANPDASPEQVKRALEAHHGEISKRLELVGRLGDSLLKQQNDIRERIRDVEVEVDGDETSGSLDPRLKEKLIELEKEYNEVGRESARALMGSKNLQPAGGAAFGAQSGMFATQGTGSPSKLNVPNRRARNQPVRQHDIEFAAEIGQGLLVEVRKLRDLLAEKEETLRNVEIEKSRLEQTLASLSAKVKALEESDTHLKEVNWNLEVLLQDLKASEAQAKDNVDRLHAQVNQLTKEKEDVINKWDHFKSQQSRVNEENEVAIKHHETELTTLRRTLATKEAAETTLTKKVENLTQELQEAQKNSLRLRLMNDGLAKTHQDTKDPLELRPDGGNTPEHSPPPSPAKATPRHTLLESETLKSSLQHAHRMITNLKSTVHREKTEKAELRRLLQEARDEVEQARAGMLPPGSAGRGNRKNGGFKKPAKPVIVGGLLPRDRQSRHEIFVENDEDWVDERSKTPSIMGGPRLQPSSSRHFEDAQDSTDVPSEAFETANETEGFETANDERDTTTETEAFQTGAESIAEEDEFSTSDELTETEGTIKNGEPGRKHGRKASSIALAAEFGKLRHRDIAEDTSEDDEQGTPNTDWGRFSRAASEDVDEEEVLQRLGGQKFKVRANRSGRGRLGTRVGSNNSLFNTAFPRSASPLGEDIPTSGMAGARLSAIGNSPPAASEGKSLFAELGEGMEDEDEEEEEESEPATPTFDKPIYVDSGCMTEIPYPEEVIPEPPKTPKMVAAVGTDPVMEIMTPKRTMAETGSGPIAEIMTPKPVLADSGSGPIAEIMTPKAVMAETGSGPIDEIRTPKAVLSHMGTDPAEELRTPKRFMSEASTGTSEQFRTPKRSIMAEMATSPITPSRSNMNEIATDPIDVLRTPKPLMTSSATQFTDEMRSPKAEMTSSGVQYEEEEKVEQPKAVLVDSSTQFDPELEAPALALAPSYASSSVSVATERPMTAIRESDSERPTTAVKTAGLETAQSPISEQNTPKKVSENLEESSGAQRSVSPSPQRADKSGFLGGLFGWKNRRDSVSEQHSEAEAEKVEKAEKPVKEENAPALPAVREMVDSGAQTTLTFDVLGDLDRPKTTSTVVKAPILAAPAITLGESSRPTSPARPKSPSILRSRISEDSVLRTPIKHIEVTSPTSPVRPSSSRSSNYPPLPPNHQETIQKHSVGSMGPPLAPASASRQNSQAFRPRTPSTPNNDISNSLAGTTPRPHNKRDPRAGGSGVYSSLSHRSSMSSFASELETRFNIQDGTPVRVQDQENGTDPKMIQAITQTMIGEYLWKYTRNTGRGSMSANRHRRFFWIHPYTRTLYWSDRDPATAGRSELKAKSVSIEAVRVITDDNPMPPGLHRKSLVIITPGRSLKFTAPTGQRHETWFNALSYLLLRSNADEEADLAAQTNEDLRDFQPGNPRNSLRAPSMSSYNSRTTHASASPSRVQSSLSTSRPRPVQYQGSMSRLSNMFRPGGLSTFSSRHSRHDAEIYDASVAGDSQEDLGEEHGHHHHHHHGEDGEGLENVRACCDGKHDVGTLNRKKVKKPTASWRISKEQARSQSAMSHREASQRGL